MLISPAGDTFEVVVVEAELLFDGAEVLAHLFVEIIDERLHHVVVEHLAKLGLVPTILEFLGAGNRDVALRGTRQQSVAGRNGGQAEAASRRTNEIAGARRARHEMVGKVGPPGRDTRIGGSRVRRVMDWSQFDAAALLYLSVADCWTNRASTSNCRQKRPVGMMRREHYSGPTTAMTYHRRDRGRVDFRPKTCHELSGNSPSIRVIPSP